MIIKIKKIFRYIGLYGLNRTVEKILTFIHTNYNFINIKKSFIKINETSNIGLIGCGNFAFSTICFFLSKKNKNFLISSFDIDKKKSESLTNFFGGKSLNSVSEIFQDNKIKLIYISSSHSSHAEYAISCIENNKHVHIEKPHIINFDQLIKLNKAMKNKPNIKVFLGFNRPFSKITQTLKKKISEEKGYNISNFFILGHKLPKSHWYYDPGEGSRVISNLCHWSDLLIYLTPYSELFPIDIIPSSPQDDGNFSISVIFDNKSFSNLIFSSNADTFEGVRECINIQRGDLYAKIIDYKYMDISKNHLNSTIKDKVKDQGHELSILNSYNSVMNNSPSLLDRKYIILTGFFFLKLDEAIKNNKKIRINEKDFLMIYQ